MKLPSKYFISYDNYLSPLIPELNPPKDWSILKTEVLFGRTVSHTGINAQLLQLNSLGYFDVQNKDKKVVFVKTEKPPEQLPPELQILYGILFNNTDSIQRNEDSFYFRRLFESNLPIFRDSIINLNLFIVDQLTNEGYLYRTREIAWKLFLTSLIPMFITILVNIIWGFNNYAHLLFIGFVLSVVLLQLIYKNMLITKKGWDMIRHIQGLHMYIDVAENEKISFENNPDIGLEKINPLLPYVILFRMENKWWNYLPISLKDLYSGAEDNTQENFILLHMFQGLRKKE